MLFKKNKKLCPRCKTGQESYELDSKSWECPYILMHNGKTCAKFVELDDVKKYKNK